MNHTLHLITREAQAIATFAAVAVKDDISPILQAVHITVAGEVLTVQATDRYMAVRMTSRLAPGELRVDGEWVVDVHDLAAHVAKQRAAKIDALAPVEITVGEPGEQMVIRSMAGTDTYPVDQRRLSYPPVGRLFPEHGFDGPFADEYLPVGYDMHLLTRLAKLRTPTDLRVKAKPAETAMYGMRFLPARQGFSKPKPAPMYLFRQEPGGSRYGVEALIQPNTRGYDC